MYALGRVAVVVGLVAGSALVPAGGALAACQSQPPAPGVVTTDTPYVQSLYGPDRLAPLATGKGIRVAVIDSGVDNRNPQLADAVTTGKDFLRNGSAREDCNGHGTMVASLIAARKSDRTPFLGLAPDATIIPVRVSEQVQAADGTLSGDGASVQRLAAAINWAASPGGGNADIINMSLTTTADNGGVRDAVRAALRRGVVIVAATGNNGAEDTGNPTPYPAAYEGVIGVGAVDASGRILGFSGHGEFVDIVAPGQGLTASALRSGQTSFDGTSAATPLVAAAAALVLQRYPGSTPEQVSRRLLATADPSGGGRASDEYGKGILNPYRAISGVLNAEPEPTRIAPPLPDEDPAAIAARKRQADSQELAMILAAAGGGLVLLVFAAGLAMRAGRRRGWRPGTAD